MAEFKLGRIRFVWKGVWASSTQYYVDDVVKYGGQIYICTVGHTAAADFNTDLEASSTRWNLMSGGQDWKGDWTTATLYKLNDLVKYGGSVYVCTDSHTSAATAALGLEQDLAKWDTFAEGFDWKGDWAVSTRYKLNDLVKYGGYTYVCNTGHTSAATEALGLENNQSSWDSFNEGVVYKGVWATTTRYKINDVVKYGAGLWICTTAHTSSSSFDTGSFAQFVEGFEFESTWSGATTYQPGDVVGYGGNQYVSKTVHSNVAPTDVTSGATNWDLYSQGFKFQSDWSNATSYKIGEVVRLNGYTYLATADSASDALTITATTAGPKSFTTTSTTGLVVGKSIRFTGTTFGNVLADATYYIASIIDSTSFTISTTPGGSAFSPTTASGSMTGTVAAMPTNASYWARLNSGIRWQGTWADDYEYVLGDAVRYGSNTYICVLGHRSEADDGSTVGSQGGGAANSRPDQDLTGTYWNALTLGSETSVLTTTGDLVYYSGAGPARLPIGTAGQVLQVNANNEPEWAHLWQTNHVYYVAPHGVDGPFPTYGGTLQNPWASVRYACEQIDKGPRNPNAQFLLEMNRAFIQREVTEWIQRQISTNTTPFTSSFVYDDFKCERDTGFIVDALIHDLGHGGNVKSRGAALAYVNAITEDSPGTYVTLGTEKEEDVAAFTYMLEVVQAVLNNEAPAVNYQVLNGDNSTSIVSQYIDTDYAAETGTMAQITSLVGIVTDAITAGVATDIPERDAPANVVHVKTGTYTETLPIIVPAETCLLGDEVRAVHVEPSEGTVSTDDAKYSIGALNRLETIAGQIIIGTDVTETSGNTEVQSRAFPYASSVEKTSIEQLVRVMGYNIDFRLGTMAKSTLTDPTNYNTSYLSGYGDARTLVRENKKFFQEQVKAYITANYSTLKYSKTACMRDVGYIVDAMIYDLTYGGNSQAVVAGLAYYQGTGSSRFIDSTELAATLASYNYLKSMVQAAVANTTITTNQSVVGQFKDTSLTGGSSASTFLGNNFDTMILIVTDGPSAAYSLSNPSTSWVAGSLTTASSTLSSATATIQTNTITYINTNYPTLTYDSAKCSRDVGTILDAVRYDFMFNSNFQTMKAAYAYLRATAVEVYSLGQKAATRAALSYVSTQAQANVGGDATAQARIASLMTMVDDIIYSGSTEGSVCATAVRGADYAVLQLERNRAYIVAEISAYIAATYTTSVSAATAATDAFTCTDTSWMQRNAAIRFTGTTFGGVSTGTTYYVHSVVSSTQFRIATTRNATTAFNVSADASGTMAVSLYYSSTLCLRDVNRYIDALKYDLKYTGNYKSLLAARYYANAVNGSLEEDMFYLRNGTGVRNMTLEGLTGDLTPANSYGTSRVTAGAYASLDPGWGPADFRTWIISRSPYVQNCCTFGTAAIGQKIDGALHTGGNKSIVSNDFTQLISDGIGAWVTNNGRAELVSVFTYYSHIGYLAENGGRIRGTNGNNSYGDFGSVAEGYDSTETPNTAVVDNRAFKATVGSVYTDGSNDIYNFEFDNAGSEYTEATWIITGAGTGAVVETDEFRDDAVFQVRLLDNVDDSTDAPEADGNFGGFGYLTNSNTAQTGSSTSITIAATDSEISSAYVGMKIYLTGGTGVGQYGVISAFNAGTKVVSVNKESTGTSGWDHVVPGTTIESPDASTTYTIEPRVSFTAPGFTGTASTLPTSGTWTAAKYGDTATSYTALTGTYSGSGASGATWTVIRNGSKYFVTNTAAGTGYTRLETITIAGTSLGGLSTANDLVITITAVNSVSGAIQAFETSGYGLGGRFVAVRSGSQIGATSEDGITWTTRTTLMPSGATWTALSSGIFDDNSTNEKVSRFVAVASGSASAASSADGITWTAQTLPVSANWVDVTFGEQKFVAIASNSTTVAISNDGDNWDVTGTLPSTGFTSVTYGMGLFVAVKSGTTAAAYSTDGVTWSSSTLPASSAWNSVTWGNGKFVTVATDSNSGAYSLNGTTWTAVTIGSADGSSVSGYQKVAYGQGVFMVTAYLAGFEDYSFVTTSDDGVNWTVRGIPGTENGITGWNALAFGNPQRTGRWVVLQKDAGTQAAYIRTGATAKARAYVAEEKIYAIRLVEPGSGYDSTPTMTITDPNNTYEAPFTVRTGKGALATPSFKDRGTGFSSAQAEVDTGDGYGDFFQDGAYVAVKRLTARPVPGSNVVFGHLPSQTFKLVNVLTFLGSYDGSYTAFFQLSPNMKKINAPSHNQSVTTRIRYSQVRLTGHDFLDIGTGNFTETNYPNTPTQPAIQANETVEGNGGRVFFTSTDQDGNFRVGDLFTIEQSTGVATLNADAFNIAGLQELTLGEVSLGGGSASITEFSTDPYFTANSDNIVPTQRAIKAYISSQIGGGGASLNVNSVTAGSIYIATNYITTVAGTSISVNAKMNFTGGITGTPLAFNYFIL